MSKKVAPTTAFPQGPGNSCQSTCGGELSKAVKVRDFIDFWMLFLPIYDSTNLNEKSFSGNSIDYLGNICNCVDFKQPNRHFAKSNELFDLHDEFSCLTKYLKENDLR